MTLSRFTNVGSITSLVDAGLRVLNRTSENTLSNLALFVDGMDSDTYHANDQLVFLRGIVAIDNPRLFKTGAIARQFANRLTAYDLYRDVGEAFALPDVVRMSSHSGALLEKQIDLMDRVTTAAGEHAGIMMLLGLMKERLGGHYYHGLRAGIAFCSLFEAFDPDNELPLGTKLLAGIIHDVGKLEVSRDILFKPEKLTREETAIMTAHDVATEHILAAFNMRFPHLSQVAANHHLSNRVSANDNPHVERAGVLMRMADIYDALASRRDYKPPFPAEKVASIMFSEGYFPDYPAEVMYLLSAFPCPKS